MRDDDRLAEELVLLVDGRLDPERAAALEELARADAGLAARIALVRSGRDHVRTAADSVEAPFELRRRVGDLADARPARGARRRRRPLAALAGLGAVAALVIALVLTGGAPSVESILDVAENAPAAAVSPTGGPLLEDEVEGVPFPDYSAKFGWRATGRREDDVDGRAVTTVTYEKGGRRVSYSIVAGDALDEPEGAGPRGRGHDPAADRRRERGHLAPPGSHLRHVRRGRGEPRHGRRARRLEGQGRGAVLSRGCAQSDQESRPRARGRATGGS